MLHSCSTTLTRFQALNTCCLIGHVRDEFPQKSENVHVSVVWSAALMGDASVLHVSLATRDLLKVTRTELAFFFSFSSPPAKKHTRPTGRLTADLIVRRLTRVRPERFDSTV